MENFVQSIFANIPALIAIIAWSLAWKGVALWKSARRDQIAWFIAILLLNTLGILEIIYIFAVGRKKPQAGPEDSPATDENRKKII